jgi:protease-4
MNDTVLRQQWQFLLLSQVYRGLWAVKPEIALSQGATVQQILNRDWTGRDQTEDLNDPRRRAQLPVAFISQGGNVLAASAFDKAPAGAIAVIPVKGTMLKYGTMCTYGTEEIATRIDEATAHKNVSGVILDIDSGGGSIDAVAPMLESIKKSIAAGKPVVASCDLAASAAYWTASACSRIVANNDISAEFGSIGVMMSFHDMKPYYEKEGIKFHTIYAPESDYKNKPFELALKGEYELIKEEELSPMAIGFQNAVKANRAGKLKMDVIGLLNGRCFFAKNDKEISLNAKEVGLIDEVGTFDTAVRLVRDLAKSAFVDKYINS